jgi:HEAT repeat protein
VRPTFWFAAVISLGLLLPRAAAQTVDVHEGIVPQPQPLGGLIEDAQTVFVLRVVKVNTAEQVITFKKVADLKGLYPDNEVRHSLHGLDDAAVRLWARPGREVVCFSFGGKAVTCLGRGWYYNYGAVGNQNPWMTAPWVDGFTSTYVGSVQRLREHIAAILAGKEVIVPAAVPTNDFERHSASPIRRDWLRTATERVRRVKASLKITRNAHVESDDSPYFVGWGAAGAEAIPGLVAALKDRDALARAGAATDLGQLETVTRPALAALRSALRDEDPYVRIAAAQALARSDADDALGVSALAGALKDGDVAVRRSAVMALADLGAPARAAVPALLAALGEDSDAKARAGAAYALGQLALVATPRDPPSREAVAALAKALREDRDEGVREWAVRGLLKFGPDAGAAAAELTSALRDESRQVADLAADVLTRLGPGSVPALVKALHDPRCNAHVAIVCHLGDLGPGGRLAVPALVETLKDDEPGRVINAAAALVRIDRPAAARSAVPALIRILKDEDDSGWHWKATQLLGEIGPDARAAGRVLCERLSSKKASVRRVTIEALEKIRPGSECCEPLLRAAQSHGDVHVRSGAATALWHAGQRRQAVALLTEMLHDDDDRVSTLALLALGKIGPGARDALPALRRLLRSRDMCDRLYAALAFFRIASRVESSGMVFDPRQEAVAVLWEALARDRQFGICVLRPIAREEPAAMRALIRLLRDPDADVRGTAAWALGENGPSAAEAGAELEALLKDEDIDNQRIAAVALLQIGGARAERPALARLVEKRPWLVLSAGGPGQAPGPEEARAVPFLLRMLRHDDRSIYQQAAQALRLVDPKAADRAGVP